MQKRILLLAATLLFSTSLFAQMRNVRKVESYFSSGKIDEKLDEAKMLMDEAIQDEKTASKERAWFNLARVYAEIASAKEPAIQQMAPNAMDVVLNAFEKIEEMEGGPDGKYGQQTLLIRENLRVALFNLGVEKQQNPEEAYDIFKDVTRVVPDDTLATKYAAFFASESGKPQEALALYRQLADNPKYDKVDVYHYMTQIMSQELQKKQNRVNELRNQEASEDEIKEAEAEMNAYKKKSHDLIKEGVKNFPDDIYLLGRNIDFYIYDNRTDEAIAMLKKAVKLAPDNPTLYTNLGLLYYRDKKDEEKGIENYEKAIELAPDDFNAQMGLAIIYYNRGAQILNDLKVDVYDDKQSPEMKAITKHFKDALPYLEKAHAISPEELQPMAPLKTVYRELGMREKEKAMDKKLQEAMSN